MRLADGDLAQPVLLDGSEAVVVPAQVEPDAAGAQRVCQAVRAGRAPAALRRKDRMMAARDGGRAFRQGGQDAVEPGERLLRDPAVRQDAGRGTELVGVQEQEARAACRYYGAARGGPVPAEGTLPAEGRVLPREFLPAEAGGIIVVSGDHQHLRPGRLRDGAREGRDGNVLLRPAVVGVIAQEQHRAAARGGLPNRVHGLCVRGRVGGHMRIGNDHDALRRRADSRAQNGQQP